MDKEPLPRYSVVDEFGPYRRRRRGPPRIIKLLILATVGYFAYSYWTNNDVGRKTSSSLLSAERLHADLATCSKLKSVPHDPTGPRERSARYIDGHNPVLIRNATIWTGEPASGTTEEEARLGKGYSWIEADVLLESGLIKRVEAGIKDSDLPKDCTVYDARGRHLTSGIVDMHSHTGVDSVPGLEGTQDTNELSGDITPFVRSIDGFNPLDPQIRTIKSGGVTTSLILPGSGNNMGGEAYVIKHAVGKQDGRTELSVEDMLADPEKNWRYMKMACGENPKRVYGKIARAPFSRLGEAWEFRHAFEQASALVTAQDEWCSAASAVGAENMPTYFPQDLKWESLSALLRGQVMLNTHCYTPTDLESFVRHTNEFNFSVRAFHHAHGSYLVPEVLKRVYGGRPPAAALFADNMNYKAEAYDASEKAGQILWENGITPVYVSDNPVLNAQHVVFEAAKAFRNGLPYHVAIAGVTSASAELLGLGDRIGKVKAGFDADIVVWDSMPLSVGAAPVQVWIDGTQQYEDPIELHKPYVGPIVPKDKLRDIAETPTTLEEVIFRNVSEVLIPGMEVKLTSETGSDVVLREGIITCIGKCEEDLSVAEEKGTQIITLYEGYLAPTLTAFGSSLGMVEIAGEEVTQDGSNSDESFSRAVDGLSLTGKDMRAAYYRGVTRAVSAPTYQDGFFKGLSVGFSTGAYNSLQPRAVWQEEVALHYSIAKSSKTPSISSSIGELRAKLEKALSFDSSSEADTLERRSLRRVVAGELPLVLSVHSADHIAAILRMKSSIESLDASSNPLRLVILGGAESHLLAFELAAAHVGVVLAPMLSFGASWDQRRALTGAPLTNGTAVDALHAAGVKVVLGTDENWQTRDLYLAAGIAFINGQGEISEKEALAMVSSNVFEILGLDSKGMDVDEAGKNFAVFEGHPLRIDGRVRAVADGMGKVEVWL